MAKVLLTIPHLFPYGAAYASRARALCKLFQAAGYETDVLCDNPEPGPVICEYGKVYGLGRSYSGAAKLLCCPRAYAQKMDQLLAGEEYSFVLSSGQFDRFGKILRTARRHRVKLILESCEWYDIGAFRRGKLDIRYYQFCRCFRHTFLKADGVIAISRLLERHYREAGKKTMRLPGIHQVDAIPCKLQPFPCEKLRLLFFGNIGGGKESFSELLQAMASLKTVGESVQLHIYGPDQAEVFSALDGAGRLACEEIKESIVFHGMIPQDQLLDTMSQYDFGVFFRPDRRSSHAGFPTKLGEYLGAGLPVITNDTGDISTVLQNGVNGFLLPRYTNCEQIREVLQKCMQLSVSEKTDMRTAARKSAEELLDYCMYAEPLKAFLKDI